MPGKRTMKNTNESKAIYRLVMAAMFLALALCLPFLTGQIPQMGKSLCPMHIPIMLCGFFCGPWYGLVVGLIAPLLRFLLFGAPAIIPEGVAMSLELATYGAVIGWLYILLPKKRTSIYVSLIGAMLLGRVIWGVVRTVLLGVAKVPFSFEMFITGGFVTAIPGILIQIVLIPILVMSLRKYTYES